MRQSNLNNIKHLCGGIWGWIEICAAAVVLFAIGHMVVNSIWGTQFRMEAIEADLQLTQVHYKQLADRYQKALLEQHGQGLFCAMRLVDGQEIPELCRFGSGEAYLARHPSINGFYQTANDCYRLDVVLPDNIQCVSVKLKS